MFQSDDNNVMAIVIRFLSKNFKMMKLFNSPSNVIFFLISFEIENEKLFIFSGRKIQTNKVKVRQKGNGLR